MRYCPFVHSQKPTCHRTVAATDLDDAKRLSLMSSMSLVLTHAGELPRKSDRARCGSSGVLRLRSVGSADIGEMKRRV